MEPSPSTFGISGVRVLAFVRGWTLLGEQQDTVQAIRERVRTLGAELIVVSETGVWSLGPADVAELGTYTDRLAGDGVIAATAFAARDGGNAVFVVDDGRVVRVGQPASNLLEALDAASELVSRRRVFSASAEAPVEVQVQAFEDTYRVFGSRP